MTLVWPNGKVLRVNVRVEGRFGVDDGARQLLEGFTRPGGIFQLTMVLDAREIAVYARQESQWQELARFPRGEFGQDPSAVRLGKTSPGSRNEDHSLAGPKGQCRFERLQVFGAVAAKAQSGK
jgi:hypothetical protein